MEEGLTLILNTAEKRIQFVLYSGKTIHCYQDWNATNKGTELLTSAMRQCFLLSGTTMANLQRIACVVGPGNFTGLRIGITTAIGLSKAVKAKQAPINYLQCVAQNVLAGVGERIVVMTNAKKGLAYVGIFEVDAKGFPQFAMPLFTLSSLQYEKLTDFVQPDWIVGSAAQSSRDVLQKIFPDAKLMAEDYNYPSLASLLKVSSFIDWNSVDKQDLVPLYARECDAMENFESIVSTMGRNVENAKVELQTMLSTPLDETK